MTASPLGRVVGVLVCLVSASVAPAAVSVPPLFSDHMVIQRDKEVPVWGKAAAGEKVTVSYAGKTAEATADDKGEWSAKLPPVKIGDAASLTIAGDKTEKPLVFEDVIPGDVWIASGQSNMQFQVKNAKNAEAEMAAAKFPNIRFFRVPLVTSTRPTKELKGGWVVVTPKTVGDCSAVAYYFAREIHQKEAVPVGLIDNSWGGMPAESFTSEEMLKSDPDFAPLLKRKADAGGSGGDAELVARQERAKKSYERHKAEWDAKYLHADPGNKGLEQGWAKIDLDDSADWKSMTLPQHWEDAGLKIDGAVWFRKEVQIPAEWEGKDLQLALGSIDDFDTAYFNGQQVGKTEGDLSVFVSRNYAVPKELVKAGRAVIAVRVWDRGGPGGITGPAAVMKLAPKDAEEPGKAISLAGQWKYKVEVSFDQPATVPPPPTPPPQGDAPYLATNIYNAMVYPVIPYAIKGVIWYQGESNADRAEQYRKLFPAMIRDWRNQWKQGDFPFLFVQLANYSNGHERPSEPADSKWAELREAQSMTLAAVPNTAQAVIIDIGESKDIHPKNKQDVGKRLALAAEKLAYGKDVEFSSPVYKEMHVEGDKVRLTFDHAAGLKTKDGGPPKGFQIAGDDQKWHWADAKIDGQDVVVWSEQVSKPAAVRYGWADDPVVNVYNGAGLPVSPFRTDDWKMATAGAK